MSSDDTVRALKILPVGVIRFIVVCYRVLCGRFEKVKELVGLDGIPAC